MAQCERRQQRRRHWRPECLSLWRACMAADGRNAPRAGAAALWRPCQALPAACLGTGCSAARDVVRHGMPPRCAAHIGQRAARGSQWRRAQRCSRSDQTVAHALHQCSHRPGDGPDWSFMCAARGCIPCGGCCFLAHLGRPAGHPTAIADHFGLLEDSRERQRPLLLPARSAAGPTSASRRLRTTVKAADDPRSRIVGAGSAASSPLPTAATAATAASLRCCRHAQSTPSLSFLFFLPGEQLTCSCCLQNGAPSTRCSCSA